MMGRSARFGGHVVASGDLNRGVAERRLFLFFFFFQIHRHVMLSIERCRESQ